jgi:hypothetical protein
MRYKRTVPVWVLETGEFISRESHASRGVQYMNTKQFVSWLSNNPTAFTGRTIVNDRSSTGSRGTPGSHQATVPLPSIRISGPPSVVPLPSARASGAIQPPGPPSYVSQLGDVDAANRNPLALAESDFRSVPRLDGGIRFDPDEYVQRINRLNEARVGAGLLPVNGVTPSTYTR